MNEINCTPSTRFGLDIDSDVHKTYRFNLYQTGNSLVQPVCSSEDRFRALCVPLTSREKWKIDTILIILFEEIEVNV